MKTSQEPTSTKKVATMQFRPSRTLICFGAIGVLLALAGLASAMEVFSFGTSPADAQLFACVPPPAGFVEASGRSTEIRALARAGQPASVRLVGIYYEPNTLDEILKKGYTEPAAFCKALAPEISRSTEEAQKDFKQLVAGLKKEAGSRFDPSDPRIRRVLSKYERAARELDPGVSIKVDSQTFLGVLLEKETAFAFSAVASFARTDGQTKTQMPFAVATAFLRLGRQRLDLNVVFPYRDAASVTNANRKLLEWVAQIEKRSAASGNPDLMPEPAPITLPDNVRYLVVADGQEYYAVTEPKPFGSGFRFKDIQGLEVTVSGSVKMFKIK